MVEVMTGLLLAAGCASPPDHFQPLADVQTRFDAAAGNGTPQYAPVAFDEARDALRTAQDALGNADADRLQHLTYMADTRLRIATAQADEKRLRAERRQLADQRDSILLQSREVALNQAQGQVQQERARAEQAVSQLSQYEHRASDQGTVLTLRNVNFALDSAELQPGDQRNLEPLVRYLKAHPDQNIRIDGFTDSQGSSSYNRDLSRRRAAAVEAFLSARGVDSGRITVEGLGETLPVASNDTAAGRLENRRIEVTLLNERQG
jgi:outer membrane protein OmpA-like peptidoglycan-associated protein